LLLEWTHCIQQSTQLQTEVNVPVSISISAGGAAALLLPRHLVKVDCNSAGADSIVFSTVRIISTAAATEAFITAADAVVIMLDRRWLCTVARALCLLEVPGSSMQQID